MNKLIRRIENFNLYTPILGYIRTLLIFSTILVLSLNSTKTLFSYIQFDLNCTDNLVPSAYCLIPSSTISFEILRFVMITVLLVAISGYFPKITSILHWYICYSIQSSAITVDGGDQIATVITFLLIPIMLFDNRKNHFYQKKNLDNNIVSKTIIFFFYNLIRLQICIIYLNAAIGRLKNHEWADGTAIYYFFKDPIFGVSELQYTLLSPVLESNLLILVTWSVTILELFLAANIIGNPTSRLYALVLGSLLHIGIILTIGIWSFSLVMISCLFLYLVPIEDNNLLLKLKKRGRYYVNKCNHNFMSSR